jgi:hypothetical protein
MIPEWGSRVAPPPIQRYDKSVSKKNGTAPARKETAFGKRMRKLSEKAAAAQPKLLTLAEIQKEMERRRGSA